jgi:hypothetical protein
MYGSKEALTMLRFASLSILAVVSSLALLACDSATIATGSGGGGNGGGTSSSSSSSSGGGADTCTPAGGTCVPIVPDACANGTWDDTATCGTGEGVGCCLPKAAPTACETLGGTCVPIVPDACANGTWGDPTTCGTGVGVGCCLPTTPTCDVTCTTEGAKRCVAGAVETCATNPMTNCAPVWGGAVPCGASEQCSSDGTHCVPVSSTCTVAADCGCGCGCISGTCECTGGLPPSCTTDSECGPACSGFRCSGGQCQAPVCQPGADQTCNEVLSMSALAGSCNSDATCTCKAGYTKKASGKCGP